MCVCVHADVYSGGHAPSPLPQRCGAPGAPRPGRWGRGVPGRARRCPAVPVCPRRTHPEHEGVDDEQGFQTRYHGFGLHSPRCHNTEIPAAGWAREEAEEEGGQGEGEGSGGAEGGELSARLPRLGSPRLLLLLLPLLPPGDSRPRQPRAGHRGLEHHLPGAAAGGRAFTGMSRGGGGGLEVLKDEVKDTPRPPPFLGKVLGGVAWAAQGLGDGGAAWSELQRELPVREKNIFQCHD